MKRSLLLLAGLLLVSGLNAQDQLPFNAEEVATFDEPWAVSFLPDQRMLVTEKKGNLFIVTQDGVKTGPIGGIPDVDYGGQGGMGDVIAHPDFANNQLIYISYVESGNGDVRGAAVARGILDDSGRRPRLRNAQVIWRQYPKLRGRGHYGHRLAFDKAGFLWISSGDRQKFTPSQDMQSTIGKMLRLNDDGSIPADNPFVGYRDTDPSVGGDAPYGEIWSLGHRNPLGIAFAPDGKLWVMEMGPAGGDELNLIKRGANYGYPVVSNGDHYDGREIPDHDTRPEFSKPAYWWTPVVSPGDLMIYHGGLFGDWRGDALVAGLSSNAIVRLELTGESANEVARYPMGARIRSLEEGPDGAIWVLEDERRGTGGRLLKLTPKG